MTVPFLASMKRHPTHDVFGVACRSDAVCVFVCVCVCVCVCGVRFRRGSLRNGYHIQGRQQSRRLPFERLPYQLSMVVAVPTMVTTGDGESGFDSGEGA